MGKLELKFFGISNYHVSSNRVPVVLACSYIASGNFLILLNSCSGIASCSKMKYISCLTLINP